MLTVSMVWQWFPPQHDDFPLRNMNWCGDDAILINATGQSMHPMVNRQGLIYMEPVKPAEVKIGDVVRWERGDTAMIHAVIRTTPDKIQTQGYNNLNPDFPISRSGVTHRYCLPSHAESR